MVQAPVNARPAAREDAPAIAGLAAHLDRHDVATAGLHELERSSGSVSWSITRRESHWLVATDSTDELVGYLAAHRSGAFVVVFAARVASGADNDAVIEPLLQQLSYRHGDAEHFYLDVDASVAVWFEARYRIRPGTRFAPFDPGAIPEPQRRMPLDPWEPGANPAPNWISTRR